VSQAATEVPAPGYADVALERDVEYRLSDGLVLRADVYRPASEVSLPVLLMRLPYGKTTAGANWGYAHPAWYASRGYVVAIQDVRGRFASDGDFYPFRDEGRDGYEAVEWAARLPGSNGAVGMYGFSYPGATQLLAAAEQPPSLAAIAREGRSAPVSSSMTTRVAPSIGGIRPPLSGSSVTRTGQLTRFR